MAEQKMSAQKGKLKIVAIAIVAIVIVAVVAYALTGDLRTYSQALKLEQATSYDEAIAVYKSIPNYKDATTRISECKYQQAFVLEQAKNYAEAQIAFEALGAYSDSATHANECKYQQALALEAARDYANAQIAFEAISEYSDAAAHANECKYQQALALENAKIYPDAQAAFEALGEYSDAASHVNECKYQQALLIESTGPAADALTAFTDLGDYRDSATRASGIQQALHQHDTEVARIGAEERVLNEAIASAEELIADGKMPLDPAAISDLRAAVDAAPALIQSLPAAPRALSDLLLVTESLQTIDYTALTERILSAKTALEDSIKQQEFVTAPEEAFVIDRLSRVPDIAYIAAVTEDNDPNNQLGKAGGYTAQVYFSSTLVSSAYAQMPNMDVIEAGTECGGSIEVYATVEDAERRSAYLGSFDGTMFASGSRKVIGTIIVRTSNSLKASQQKMLEAEIVDALTSLNPGPIIERPQVVEEDKTGGPQATGETSTEETPVVAETKSDASQQGSLALVSVKEIGYAVDNGWLHYAMILQSNLSDTAIQYPELRITSRDANGNLLGVTTQVLMVLYPEQEAVWASLASEVSEVPASVEVELVEPQHYNLVAPTKLEHPEYIPLEVQGASLKKGDYSATLIGEVYNPNNYDIPSAAINVIFRDTSGKLMAGCNGFCNGVKAGGKAAFEIYVQSELIGETYEVYAMPW